MNLKRLSLVLLLSCLLPSYGFSDVIFTDAQYEELSQTLDLLQKEQEKQKKYEEDLKKQVQAYKMTSEDLMRVMQERQSYYKKRTTFWIAGSALMIIASSVISYEVGKHHEYIR